jgi:hypothetical protein
LVTEYMNTGVVEHHTGATCGFASQALHSSLPVLTSSHETILKEEMDKWNNNGQVVTGKLIQTFIKEQWGMEMTMARLYRYFHDWGWEYRKVKEMTPVDPIWHARRIARFIAGYHKAVKEENSGMYTIVYVVRHTTKYAIRRMRTRGADCGRV